MTEKNENMQLWDHWCKTPSGAPTKEINKGGFRLTAIDAQWQIKQATALWGPYGTTWGIKDLVWGTVGKCKTTYGKARTPIAGPAEITLSGIFWYPDGEFPIGGDCFWRPDGDSRKKLLTDITTKALSKLGMNSDIFEGKFDGNRYTQPVETQASTATTTRPLLQQATQTQPQQTQQPQQAQPAQTQPAQQTQAQPTPVQDTSEYSHLRVDECKVSTTKTQKPMLATKLTVLAGHGAEQSFRAWFTMVPWNGEGDPPFPFRIIRRFCRVTTEMHLIDSNANLFPVAQAMPGKEFLAKLKDKTYTDRNEQEQKTLEIDAMCIEPLGFQSSNSQPEPEPEPVQQELPTQNVVINPDTDLDPDIDFPGEEDEDFLI